MPDPLRQILNGITLIGVLWFNALAGSGALSGESIGLIANRYASYFLPAGYVFGIWSLIYLALIGFTVYQALPGQKANAVVRRIGVWWAVNGVLNIAWVVTFSYSLFGTAMLVMVALLGVLIVIHGRIGLGAELGWADRIFVSWPFALYLAWIAVAVIANLSQYLTFLEWSGLGLAGPVWSVILMVVATTLGSAMVFRRGLWIFPPVVAWALIGIARRYPDQALVRGAAWTLVVVGLGLLAVWVLTRRRVPTTAA
jgi:benzodiazapine receptor